jgi:hypothetical protein
MKLIEAVLLLYLDNTATSIALLNAIVSWHHPSSFPFFDGRHRHRHRYRHRHRKRRIASKCLVTITRLPTDMNNPWMFIIQTMMIV